MIVRNTSPLSLFDRLMADTFSLPKNPAVEQSFLYVDVAEEDGEMMIQTFAPGANPEDIQVSVENQVLTIQVESRIDKRENAKLFKRELQYGKASRSFKLPDHIDVDSGKAELLNGVLTLRFQSAPEKAKRIIAIENKNV